MQWGHLFSHAGADFENGFLFWEKSVELNRVVQVHCDLWLQSAGC